MKTLTVATFLEQPFCSDAYIFSPDPVRRETATDLLYAQMIVEAKLLGQFPTFVIPAPADPVIHCTHLFEDVYLLYPESWEIVDNCNAFLLNSRMYEFCATKDAPFLSP